MNSDRATASGVVKCDQCQNAVKDGEYQNLDSGHVLCDRCRDTTVYETSGTKRNAVPSRVTHAFRIFFNFGSLKKSFGKWMVFDHYDKIDRTWENIRSAMARNQLPGCSAKCTTMRYDPTAEGPGPSTQALICVYTEEENADRVGFNLIKIVKRDINYKTDQDTRHYKYSHAGNWKGAQKTIFWNGGKPAFNCKGKRSFATSRKREDIWHLNVVTAISSKEISGWWALQLEYQELSEIWHSLKDCIESETKNFGIIRMVCPPKLDRKSQTEKPVFHVFTSRDDCKSVGMKLIELVKRDITFKQEPQQGAAVETPDDYEKTQGDITLLWNQGKPVYASTLDKRLQHMKAYEEAIKEKIAIEIRFIRLNYIGLPRSGKTSFLRRILGEILNILEAITKGEKEQPSTGVAEEGGQVVIQTTHAEISSGSWSILKDLGEEARMIIQWIHRAVQNTNSLKIKSSVTSLEEITASPDQPDSTLVDDCEGGDTHNNTSLDVSDQLVTTTSIPLPSSRDSNSADILSVFEKAMESDDWSEIKHVLEETILVSNTDTGGHTEFLDLHGSLVHGPSLNLLFRRLIDGLDKNFGVYFTNEDGVCSEKEDSIITMEEVMFQALSSVASFCQSFSERDALPEEETSALYKTSKQSKAMIVGTFLDRVTTEEAKEKDDLFQEKIKNTEFFEKSILEFASEDQLMIMVDNMNGKQDEIDRIRKILENVIERCFEKITIPASWLALNLYIRSLKLRTISLQDCEDIASKAGIDQSELQDVLWFLHHHVGTLLYYPEVEALKSTIICDIQVVFDSASNLIKNTFVFEKVGKHICEKFKSTAMFTLTDVRKAASKYSDSLIIPLEKLIELLKHLNILTTFPQVKPVSEPTYFMPCVLKSVNASKLSMPVSTEKDPAPLMIRYNCGYTPIGLFPAVITSLVSQHSEIGWEMIEDGLCKNRVQFNVGKDYDTVTLLLHPQFIEIAISRDRVCTFHALSIIKVCTNIRSIVVSTLENITSHMNSNFTMGYKFGFECPTHPGKKHLCVLLNQKAVKMECLQNPKRKDIVEMGPRHKVWFSRSASEDLEVSVGIAPNMRREILASNRQFSAMPTCSQRSSHLDVFNQMLPVMRNSIAGSVDGLCLDAIARNLMTFPEQAGILEGDNRFKHASRFLEHFALKIEVSPEVLFQFKDMLTELGTCDGVLQKLTSRASATLSSDRESAGNVPQGAPVRLSTPPSAYSTYVGNCSVGVPTLREFIRFPMSGGTVNLAQAIGTKYTYFGILLLEDDNGDRTDTIVSELDKRAEDINAKIFRLWVKGEGLQPVSWATLVGVLQDMELNTLARNIEHAKCPSK